MGSSFWRYVGTRIVHFVLIYAVLVFAYSVLLNGQIEFVVHQTLGWSAARAVQGALASGAIQPEEAEAYREEVLLGLERAYGFDKPFLVRAGNLFLRTVRLEFGNSHTQTVIHTTHTPKDTLVMRIIAEAMIPTAILFGGAFLVQALLAAFLGLRNGSKPGTALDRTTTALSIVLAGVPPFVLAMFAVRLFVYDIPIAPSDPWVYTLPATWAELGPWAKEFFPHFTLPFLTLVFASIWITAHKVRNISLNAFSDDYFDAARARGLSERRVIYRLGGRVSSPPTLTLIAGGFAASLWGGFLVEPIFQWPGIGTLFFTATKYSDTPLMMGLLVVVTGIYLFALMILDLTYGLMDPRIKVGSRARQ